jgi:hypothetical protein
MATLRAYRHESIRGAPEGAGVKRIKVRREGVFPHKRERGYSVKLLLKRLSGGHEGVD